MKIFTSSQITGKEIGLVMGSYVASKAFYKDFFAGIRNFFGWELKEYTQMLDLARKKALERLEIEATRIGATAIIEVRFTTNQTARNSTEILVYGTAIKEG